MMTVDRMKKRLKIFTNDFRTKELSDAEKATKEYKMVKPLMGAGKFTDLQLSAVLESLEASSGLSLTTMVDKLKSLGSNSLFLPLKKPFVVFKLTQAGGSHNYSLNVPIISSGDLAYKAGIMLDGSVGNQFNSVVSTAVLCTDEEIDALPIIQLEAAVRWYNS